MLSRGKFRSSLVAATALALTSLALATGGSRPAAAAVTTAPSAEVIYAAPNGTGPACTQPRPCSLIDAQQRVRHVLPTGEGKVKDLVVELAGGT